MKILNTLSGGYRRVMNILLSVQNEMITMGNAPFASLQFDLVLSGCAVHDNGNGTVDIAPGLMYVAGNTLRFDGAANIANDGSMAIVTGAVVASVLRPFADGSNKNLYSEQKAVVDVQDAGNPFQMKITTSLYNLQQYIKDQINASERKGTIKELYDLSGITPGQPGSFLANFDSTGLGVTPAWMGWARDNGNNGTPGSVGSTLINDGEFTDPLDGAVTNYVAGQQYGALKQKLTLDKQATPAGLIITLDGPHGKPADGGGAAEYYVRTVSAAAVAANAITQLGPTTAVYRVVKIV